MSRYSGVSGGETQGQGFRLWLIPGGPFFSVSLGFGAMHHPAGESARLPLLCVPLPVLGNGCAVFPRASQS